uniref:Uncharacterized protein n=1 Tax=Enterobacter asburiae TaxID=61645 RepID=A0A455VX70_ENTAS|nr:hypothetical protein MRY18106EAS_P0680 [Enterobacter asburiae]BBI97893.1 hypothetical protein MRY18106EAS_P0930 [Enterobacter asburiae]
MTVFYHDSSCSTLHIKTRALQSRWIGPYISIHFLSLFPFWRIFIKIISVGINGEHKNVLPIINSSIRLWLVEESTQLI